MAPALHAFPADTIVAIATPPGVGGVGIVRVSGAASRDVARMVFRSRLDRTWRRLPTHRMVHGYAVDAAGAAIDEVLCCFMAAPHSYTAEDVLELHGHGGPLVLRRILRRCIEAGARPAEPGEFTMRAFLNGRLDLAQAEAVADVIAARSGAALRIAQRQLRGDLSRRLEAVRAPLLALLAHCEAVIDFAEEGVPDLAASGAYVLLDQAERALARLLASAHAGRVLREGIRVTIAGRPNVGKSSLLNALLRADRAIVAAVPGTTRDTIEETVTLGGVPVTFVDTAGIQPTDDAIERSGIDRTWRALSDADVALLVLDRSAPLHLQDEALLVALVLPGASIVAPDSESDPASISGTTDDGSARASPTGRYPRPTTIEDGNGGDLRSGGDPALRRLNVASSPTDKAATEGRAVGGPRHVIVVANKCDLPPAWESADLRLPNHVAVVATSMRDGAGLDALEEAVRAQVLGEALTGEDEPALSHARHIRLLEQCRDYLAAARASIDGMLAADFTATDLRGALGALCDVTGEDATDTLLAEVFSRFCIGK